MQQLGMWDHTLMIFTSDNGGYVDSPMGGCNHTAAGAATTAAVGRSSGLGLSSAFAAGVPPAGSDVGHGTACFNGEAGANNFPLRARAVLSISPGPVPVHVPCPHPARRWL